VTDPDIDATANLLRAKRERLLEQLEAIDRELAALPAAGSADASAQEPRSAEPGDEAADPVVPTRVTSRRVLSDDHRHALTEGRRKARHSREAAAGRAREAIDPAPGLAPASATELPRLVKRPPSGSRRQ